MQEKVSCQVRGVESAPARQRPRRERDISATASMAAQTETMGRLSLSQRKGQGEIAEAVTHAFNNRLTTIMGAPQVMKGEVERYRDGGDKVTLIALNTVRMIRKKARIGRGPLTDKLFKGRCAMTPAGDT